MAPLAESDDDVLLLIPNRVLGEVVARSGGRERGRMAARKNRPSAEIDALLAEVLVDAYGDGEQLTALAEAIGDALALPIEVRVVGEPMSLLAVDYDGNPRRGLLARCRREDGAEYRVGLAEVELPRGTVGSMQVAAYLRWLGVEPPAPLRRRGVKAKSRPQEVRGVDVDLSKPLELVVLAVGARGARCRLPKTGRVITLRAGALQQVVPGHIVTVAPKRRWHRKGHPYLSGEVVTTRVDAAALGLEPLGLRECGEWSPAREYRGEDGDPIEAWAAPIIARGPRPMFEMQQVLPASDAVFASDPIDEANELKAMGDAAGAQEVLQNVLEADLRSLDAHAHLGNLLFLSSPHQALLHYEVGVRVGELSLGDGFDGVLAWGLIDNRPFLRCMQGYGLCLWRHERWQEAERVFERMLWMNPSDNQGVRFLLPEVRGREAWVDDDD